MLSLESKEWIGGGVGAPWYYLAGHCILRCKSWKSKFERERGCIDGSGFDDVDSDDDDDDDGKRIKVAGVQQQKQMQLKSQRSKMRLGLAGFGLAGRL